jgi:DNA-binding transcriptional LysR family regulator
MRSQGIELRHLRYFLMVSEELHFGRAAERLYMAQPPLSQAIRRLEGELGVVLFKRTNRTVGLTEAGRVFEKEARKVLAEFDAAVEGTRRAGGELTLKIGCAPHLPTDLLVKFFDRVHERVPRLRPELKHMIAFDQIRALQDGELDLGIFPTGTPIPKLHTERLWAREPLAAFVMPGHRLAEKEVLGPPDFADETLISFQREGNPLFAAWLEEAERIGYRFRAQYDAGTESRACILAVAAGKGVALLPAASFAVSDGGPTVIRLPIAPPLVLPETVIAWRVPGSKDLLPVISKLREVARSLYETSLAERERPRERPSPRGGRRFRPEMSRATLTLDLRSAIAPKLS